MLKLESRQEITENNNRYAGVAVCCGQLPPPREL
jgi:hypothetical protein